MAQETNGNFKTIEGFEIQNPVLLFALDARNQIWGFETKSLSRNGGQVYRITKVWKSDSTDTQWRPGKGFEVPLNAKQDFFRSLMDAAMKMGITVADKP